MYHTCYTLSGLAIAQHCELDMYPLIVGDADNEVCATHPLYNIPAHCVRQAADHFRQHSYDLYGSDTAANGFAAAASDADAVAAEVAGLWTDKAAAAPDGRAATTTMSRDSSSRERDSAERCSSPATTESSSATHTTATTTATSVSCTTEEDEEDEPSI